MDKLSAMATFARVADLGSFTRAAAALDQPKARISQRVADLERTLGVRLLERTTRTLRLTDDGQAYLERCRFILQEIEELEDAVRGHAVQPRGRVRVEVLSAVARWVIAPRLHEFQAHYPLLTVRLGASDRISHLLDDGIDCAIRGGVLEDSSLIARQAAEVRLGLYAAPGYLHAAGRPTDVHALTAHRRISWFVGRSDALAWALERGTDRCELPAGDGLLFDDHDVAIGACMAGAGICPGAPFAVAAWVRVGALEPVLPDWHFAPRPIHLLYPGQRHLSMRVRCFVDWAMELLQGSPELRMSPRALADACR